MKLNMIVVFAAVPLKCSIDNIRRFGGLEEASCLLGTMKLLKVQCEDEDFGSLQVLI